MGTIQCSKVCFLYNSFPIQWSKLVSGYNSARIPQLFPLKLFLSRNTRQMKGNFTQILHKVRRDTPERTPWPISHPITLTQWRWPRSGPPGIQLVSTPAKLSSHVPLYVFVSRMEKQPNPTQWVGWWGYNITVRRRWSTADKRQGFCRIMTMQNRWLCGLQGARL